MEPKLLCAVVLLAGCSSAAPTSSESLDEMKVRVAREAFYECRREMAHEAWRRNWDERVMRDEIARICAAQSGHSIGYHPIPADPRQI